MIKQHDKECFDVCKSMRHIIFLNGDILWNIPRKVASIFNTNYSPIFSRPSEISLVPPRVRA